MDLSDFNLEIRDGRSGDYRAYNKALKQYKILEPNWEEVVDKFTGWHANGYDDIIDAVLSIDAPHSNK